MYRNIVAAVLLSFAFAAAAFAADGKAQRVAFHVDQNDPGVAVHLMELQEQGFSYVRP
jgi:hypothetical protein